MSKKDLKILSAVYLYENHLDEIFCFLKSETTSKLNFICINVDDFLIKEYYFDLYSFVRSEPLKCRLFFESASLTVQNYLIANRSESDKDILMKKRRTKIFFSLSSPRSEIVLGRCEGENCRKSAVNQLIYVRGKFCTLTTTTEDNKRPLVFKWTVTGPLEAHPLATEWTGRLFHLGRVVKVSTPKMVQVKKRYRCRECGHAFENEADFDQFYIITEPKLCPASNACGSSRFEEISTDNKSVLPLCSLYQEITITDTDGGINFPLPKRSTVIIEDDLVGKCQMSDVIAITGILRERWQPFVKGNAPKIELTLQATWISKLNDVKVLGSSSLLEMKQKFENFWHKHAENHLNGRNLILSSLCPDIYEMYLVKLSLMLILVGGVSGTTSSGTTIRGDAHLLLIGDPGTGKSKILKHAASLAKRSTYSTGVGITSAGLTCAAVKVDGDWQLEPGALPLSHGGVCCIDEFHTLSESDRASVREAMETQGISVAKAGVKTVIPSRCAVIAAMNHDSHLKRIDAPLLSRFDLILTLNAEMSEENFDHDLKIANFLTENNLRDADDSIWSQEMIRTYISCVKDLSPTMSEGAEKILSQYFEFQRTRSFSRDDGKTTNRLRDGLIRIAQAHARLMYRSIVTVQDAIVAVFMMDCSMLGTELMGPVDVLHTYFPEDPMTDYEIKGKRLLNILGLNRFVEDMKSNCTTLDSDFNFNRVIGRLCSTSSSAVDNKRRSSPPKTNREIIAEPPSPRLDTKFDAVMTQIRAKSTTIDAEDKPKSAETNRTCSDRLKRFQYDADDDDDETKIVDDDEDLKIDLNDLVWCSSKRKKVCK